MVASSAFSLDFEFLSSKMSDTELDVAMSKLTELLGTATVETLEEAFGEIQLPIPPSATGKKGALLRTLSKHVISDDLHESADQGLSVMNALIAVCDRGRINPLRATTI